MKFEVMRDSLLEGLNDVMKAVSSKTTIPILTGLKLEVTEKGLYITGSDSDITIQTFLPVEKDGEQIIQVIEPGTIVLQARMFNEIIRKLPTNDVVIEVTNYFQTNIRSGKTEFIKYLAAHTKENEKIITIEDTLELHLDKICILRILKKNH